MNENKKIYMKTIIRRKQGLLKVSPETEFTFPFFLGQENQNVQDLEIEKLKLEIRKLLEEIQRTQLEKETMQAARNLYDAKLMLILKENKEVAPSIVCQL